MRSTCMRPQKRSTGVNFASTDAYLDEGTGESCDTNDVEGMHGADAGANRFGGVVVDVVDEAST